MNDIAGRCSDSMDQIAKAQLFRELHLGPETL